MNEEVEQIIRDRNNRSEMKVDEQLARYEQKLAESISVLEKMLNTYNHDEIFLSFNGGKDCTVLLHLMCHLYAKKYPDQALLCVYILSNDPFDEIEAFVQECASRYPIAVDEVHGDTRAALADICRRRTQLKACVMGCRRTDPFCGNLSAFQETDPGWPPIIRVNPLLEWTCQDIWKYLFDNRVPYCVLYKFGYTSIGDKSNTIPNPHLIYTNPLTGQDEYKHASQLINADELERAGRLKNV